MNLFLLQARMQTGLTLSYIGNYSCYEFVNAVVLIVSGRHCFVLVLSDFWLLQSSRPIGISEGI